MSERTPIKESAWWGVLSWLVLLGIVSTSILQFFGGSHIWPPLFLAGLVAIFIRYWVRAYKARD